MANFRSDNESPVAPEIMRALEDCNRGAAHAYGEDEWTGRLNARFGALFETEVTVLPLATGTAGNSVALAELCPPWGAIVCHRSAHIHNDECGAPEFYSGGAKLVPLDGADGKLYARDLNDYLAHTGAHGVHEQVPSAVSITQSTESGTVYRPDEIRAIADAAHARGLSLHMDGARFANACVFLDCAPADLAWRAGVDLLTFGASKNGALAAEALIAFGQPRWLPGLERRRKRAGHLISKMRYVSAQLLAYIADDLWLKLARHANAQAARFAAAVARHPEAKLAFPAEANEVFVRLPEAKLRAIQERGFEFHLWPDEKDLARLVFSHSTTAEETAGLIGALDAV